MSDAATTSESSDWKLEAIELAYYHACDNRWQWFQAPDETENESASATETTESHPSRYHRQQLTNLLRVIRDLWVRSNPREPDNATTEKDPDPTVELSQEIWNYCNEHLKKEGDKELEFIEKKPGHRPLIPNSSLCPVFRRILHRKRATKLYKQSHPLDSKNSRKLFSAFPIRRDWDVIGVFGAQASSANEISWKEGEQPKVTRASSQYGKTKPRFITPLNAATCSAGCSESKDKVINPFKRYFAYQVDYINPEKTDLALFYYKNKFKELVKCNYFDFAEIKKGYGAKVYNEYSKVTDPSTKEQPTTHFYVVVPFPACGYLTYLQFFFSFKSKYLVCDCLVNKLSAVFNDFYTKAEGGTSGHLKGCLREAIIQIRLSAFEYTVGMWMEENRSRIVKARSPDVLALECFCDLVPHINEIKRVDLFSTDREKDEIPGTEVSKHIWKYSNNVNENASGETLTKIEKMLEPWCEIIGKDSTNSNYKSLIEDWFTVAISVDEDSSNRRTAVLSLFPRKCHNENSSSITTDELLGGTNRLRIREQFDNVLHRFRRFWYSARA